MVCHLEKILKLFNSSAWPPLHLPANTCNYFDLRSIMSPIVFELGEFALQWYFRDAPLVISRGIELPLGTESCSWMTLDHRWSQAESFCPVPTKLPGPLSYNLPHQLNSPSLCESLGSNKGYLSSLETQYYIFSWVRNVILQIEDFQMWSPAFFWKLT